MHPPRLPFGPPTAHVRPSTEERPKGVRRGAVGTPCQNTPILPPEKNILPVWKNFVSLHSVSVPKNAKTESV